MSKRELIYRIQCLNRTASGSFLAQFSEEELQDYLSHLQGPKFGPPTDSHDIFAGSAPAAGLEARSQIPAATGACTQQPMLAF